MGSPRNIKPGATVTVTTKSGERRSETIESVGKPFRADNGAQFVYGYLGRRSGSARPAPARSRERRECDECGEPAVSGTTCWETGLRH
jgi:hypothetical protein